MNPVADAPAVALRQEPALQPRRERRNALFIFLITLLCAVYVFPRWADPNQNSRLNMVVAVVDDGTFRIDAYVANTVDYAKVGDHYYSDKAPGAAFLAMPVYALLSPLLQGPLLAGATERLAQSDAVASTLRTDGSGVAGDKVRFAAAQIVLSGWVAALPTALLAALLYLAAAALVTAAWPRTAVALGYALLTPAFAYSNAFYGHQLAALLLFGAFCLALWMPMFEAVAPGCAPGRGLGVRLAAIGALLGFSVVAEYPAALPAMLIALYTVWQLWRSSEGALPRVRLERLSWLLWAGLGGAALILPWMAYNNALFGAPLELGYSYSELWVDQHSSGFMSLEAPSFEALWGLTFSPFRGLFLLAPWLLLAFPGIVLWWRSGLRRAEWWLALGCVAVMLLFAGSSTMWWGGFSVGPRYLLPALPFLVLPIPLVLERWWPSRLFRLSAGLLAVASLVGVWGMTLAEQAFPPDTMANPWVDHLLPNWQSGNIARNMGTVLGLEGAMSLLPLLAAVGALGLLWFLLQRRDERRSPTAAAAPRRSGATMTDTPHAR
jgi:hypothetical protein